MLSVAPTGSGKTRIGLEAAMGAIKRRGDVLWLAGRQELVDQPVASLAKYGWHDVRVVASGKDERCSDAPLTIASIQTLVARDYMPPASLVVLDESRHYVAEEWGKIAGAYANSVRLGLDATPARSDGKGLGYLFDEIVAISTVRELTAAEFLVPSVIHAPPAYQKELAGTPLEKWREHAEGKRTIVFCTSIAHAIEVAQEFERAGIAAEALEADTPKDQRKAALDRLRTGETTVLTNCMLFTEGLDLVELECVIIARGVSHESTWLQMGGRALRPSPHTGKTEALIIDLRGHMWRHGLLDDERIWQLAGEAVRRKDPDAKPVQCPECGAAGRGNEQCRCGRKLPPPPRPRVKAKDLQAYRSGEVPQKKHATLRRFVRREMDRGKSPWRAAHIYKGAYGEKPDRAVLLEIIRETKQEQRDAAAPADSKQRDMWGS
ncbi:MAG: DEAD/DEAH box helicase [Chloroflexi bacterium]|nr:DEAD/DEAH box helicase [Chloroflexota bacterium]